MRRIVLSSLSLALLASFGTAHAQVNAFVSAAQAPGVQSIPAPPTPPGKPSSLPDFVNGAQAPLPMAKPGLSGSPSQAADMVFGSRTPPAPSKDASSARLHALEQPKTIMQAKPGQTLSAPALPKMPPLPPLPAMQNIGPAPDFGAGSPAIDQTALDTQTSAVHTLKFVAEKGKTYRLQMSSVSPNLIMAPFDHPQLITSSANAIHFVAHGSSLVVTVAPGQPVGAYLTGKSASDPLVALVFMPKALPPQNYQLEIDGFVVKAKATETTNEAGDGLQAVQGSSTQHTQRVVRLIEQTLSGSIPEGFGPVSKRHWPLGRNQAGLVVAPVEVLSSGEEIIDVLSVTNTTRSAVSLEENDFYRRGVEGVALTAHAPLEPGASLQVGILRRATQSDASDTLMSVSRP